MFLVSKTWQSYFWIGDQYSNNAVGKPWIAHSARLISKKYDNFHLVERP